MVLYLSIYLPSCSPSVYVLWTWQTSQPGESLSSKLVYFGCITPELFKSKLDYLAIWAGTSKVPFAKTWDSLFPVYPRIFSCICHSFLHLPFNHWLPYSSTCSFIFSSFRLPFRLEVLELPNIEIGSPKISSRFKKLQEFSFIALNFRRGLRWHEFSGRISRFLDRSIELTLGG